MLHKIKQVLKKRGSIIALGVFSLVAMILLSPQITYGAVLQSQSNISLASQDYGSTRGGYGNANQFAMESGFTLATTTLPSYVTIYFSDGLCPAISHANGDNTYVQLLDTVDRGNGAPLMFWTFDFASEHTTLQTDGGCRTDTRYQDYTNLGVPLSDFQAGDSMLFRFTLLSIPNYTSWHFGFFGSLTTVDGAQLYGMNSSNVQQTIDSNIASIAYAFCTTSPCNPPPPPPYDTTTRITYVYPPDGATVATGTIPVEIQGYLNSQDATSSTLQISITSKYNVYGTTQPSTGLLPGGVPLSADVYPVSIFQEFPLSGTGSFDVTSSTTITSQGIMSLQAVIVPSTSHGSEAFWGSTTPPNATSTEFIVGTSTQADYIASYIAKAISLTTTATTTFPDCTLLSSDFIPCMLVPPLPLLNAVFVQFHDQVLARWPIGIATRIFDVMATTSTSSLPTITLITPQALGFLGLYEWDLNFEAMMSNPTGNPFLWTDIDWGGTRGKDGSTIWTVIGPIYTPIIYGAGLIALALFIMWRHNKH